MNHKNKKTLARSMMTYEEIKKGESPWKSQAWQKRKQMRGLAVKGRELNAKRASQLRKEKNGQSS